MQSIFYLLIYFLKIFYILAVEWSFCFLKNCLEFFYNRSICYFFFNKQKNMKSNIELLDYSNLNAVNSIYSINYIDRNYLRFSYFVKFQKDMISYWKIIFFVRLHRAGVKGKNRFARKRSRRDTTPTQSDTGKPCKIVRRFSGERNLKSPSNISRTERKFCFSYNVIY